MYIDNPIGNTPNSDNTDGDSRTILFEETVTTSGSPVATAQLAYSQPVDADTIYVTFDGVTYTCQKNVGSNNVNYYGAPSPEGSPAPDFSNIPFSIANDSFIIIATQTAGTHTVKVEVESSGGGGGASLGDAVPIDCELAAMPQINASLEPPTTLNDFKVIFKNEANGMFYLPAGMCCTFYYENPSALAVMHIDGSTDQPIGPIQHSTVELDGDTYCWFRIPQFDNDDYIMLSVLPAD